MCMILRCHRQSTGPVWFERELISLVAIGCRSVAIACGRRNLNQFDKCGQTITHLLHAFAYELVPAVHLLCSPAPLAVPDDHLAILDLSRRRGRPGVRVVGAQPAHRRARGRPCMCRVHAKAAALDVRYVRGCGVLSPRFRSHRSRGASAPGSRRWTSTTVPQSECQLASFSGHLLRMLASAGWRTSAFVRVVDFRFRS